MKPTFYPRLAWMGIKKNARLYVPYLLSCAFMAAMLYVIAYLAVTPALYTVNGKVNGSGTSAVAMTMSLGSFVVSVFIALFLFYTNSFLLRRRKKEFGLYSVLGMDRGALSAILFWETLLAAAFTLIAGLGLGLLLSYVSQSALLRLLSLPAAAFTVSLAAIKQCAITFIAIFALLYVRGVLSLRHAQGAALLKSENVGEKPPKSQWLLVIPGLALLLGAYYIAATINDPVQAMLLFFLAVIMVILSTYLLFISGSVTLCKTLQKDEKFYYKKRNFVSLVAHLPHEAKRRGPRLHLHSLDDGAGDACFDGEPLFWRGGRDQHACRPESLASHGNGGRPCGIFLPLRQSLLPRHSFKCAVSVRNASDALLQTGRGGV